jgi:peptidoglycan/LPS O-acetylase OafA/YrhL
MAATSPALQPVGNKWSAWVISGLFLIVAALVFAAIYLTLTSNQHFWALITIGILSLIFAVGSFMMEAMSRNPSAQRSLAWGFFGMGFAVLLLTIGLGPTYGVLGTVWMLWGLVIVIAVLIVAVALIGWRGRALRATENQQVPRASWRTETAPSAFSYAAANAPSVPSTAPPPPGSGGNPPPPRSP